jgi:hypothetical protein
LQTIHDGAGIFVLLQLPSSGGLSSRNLPPFSSL